MGNQPHREHQAAGPAEGEAEAEAPSDHRHRGSSHHRKRDYDTMTSNPVSHEHDGDDDSNNSNAGGEQSIVAETLHQELEQVEQHLEEQHRTDHPIFGGSVHGGGSGTRTSTGRAVFDSLGSALGSIRARLQQQLLTPSDSATTTTAMAATAASTTATESRPQTLQAFSERLQTAERSHSTRMPLGLLRSQLSSQQRRPLQDQQGTTSAGDEISLSTTMITTTAQLQLQLRLLLQPPVAAATAAAAATAELKQAVDDKGNSDEDEGEDSSSTSTRRRRRSSTLVASRRYAEAQETHDIAMHEGANLLLFDEDNAMIPEVENEEEDPETETQNARYVKSSTGSTTDKEPEELTIRRPTRDPKVPPEQEENQDEEDENRSSRRMMVTHTSIQKLESMSSPQHSSASSLSTKDLSVASSAASITPPLVAITTMYSWGTADDFQLWGSDVAPPSSSSSSSLSSTMTPQLVPATSRVGRSAIASVSIGDRHAALVTATGGLLICGNNQEGAVDPTERTILQLPRPRHLETLAMNRILQVACGLDHTAVLSETRSVLTFGNNANGQLGHRRRTTADASSSCSFQTPAAMVLPRRAAQVVCGHGFTCVLTTRMEVYVCGREELSGYNPLLEGIDGPPPVPEQPRALRGLPLAAVAAGHQHAVVVTAHGTAYAWGGNPTGACGRGFPKTLTVPVPIQVPATGLVASDGDHAASSRIPFSNWAAWESPVTRPNAVTLAKDVAVVDVVCGGDTTILITQTGDLLVAGSNQAGQLLVDDEARHEVFPMRRVTPPDGRRFVSAAAGTQHTLVLDDMGDVWMLGSAATTATIKSTGSMVKIISGKSIAAIAAGGNHSLAIATAAANKGDGTGSSSSIAVPTSVASTMLMSATPGLEGLLDGILLEQEVSKQETAVQELVDQTEELFRCPAVMNSVFMDPKEIDHVYGKLIAAAGEQSYRQRVVSAMEKGMTKGLESLKNARLMYPESVRCLLLYLQCPLFRSESDEEGATACDVRFDLQGDVILLLCETILGLPFEGYKAFLVWSTSLYGKELFVPFLVKPLIDQLNSKIETERTRAVPVIVGVLRWFQNAAKRTSQEDTCIAKPEDFYSKGIGELSMESLFDDLMRFKMAPKSQRSTNFYLCASPFLMSPSAKRNLLQVESQLTMVRAAQSAGVSYDPARREFLFQPYFILAIDRQYMLQQTLQAVASAVPGDLRKSLKVVFKGEDGVDAGGVTKEFFQLLVIQLFDVNTGMWSTNFGDGLHTWFNADCTWNQDGYYLVGILVGLAVYNSVILDVHFPQTVYRKLLGLPLGSEDMVDPEVNQGLKQLLEYEGDDVEDIFCLSFEVNWNSLGIEQKRELKPNGANIPVTDDNREEYVMLYVQWLLVDSIKSQYDEFERGFTQVMEGSSLDLLRPEELELLAVGTPELDFEALEQNAEYEGGFDKDSIVVKNLWRFVKEATREQQLQFLKFATGSIKAPIGGLAELPFKVQRAGPDSMQLPTSHTCFNTLLVPDYGDNYDTLCDRLGRAIIECEGFGLQ